jgi:ribose transport system ATP-binding protein
VFPVETMTSAYRVELLEISKSFRGVQALQKVSLAARPGEFRALAGENGAGKSTLMNILAGVYRADAGRIQIDDREVHIHSPLQAKDLGIRIVHQELALVPDLTAAENIFLESMGRGGLVAWNDLYRRAAELLQNLGFDIDPRMIVRKLSIAYQQAVEIAKALAGETRLLILDEPTAVLAPVEVEKLFALLRKLQKQDITILYASHRLEEIFAMAESITVLKDGMVVDTVLPSEVTADTLINKMIGRKLTALFPPISDIPDARPEEIFRVEHLQRGSKVRDVSFALHRGEILGIAGMVGSGRTELVRAIFGADEKDAGKLFVQGRPVSIKSPADAVQLGIGLVPEDRKAQGVLLPFSISQNIGIVSHTGASSLFALLRPRKEKQQAQELATQLNIHAHSVDMEVADLSGGNQQKVVLAKWLSRKCRIIMFDEPTRGIDVGAKAEIYSLLQDLKKQGRGVILISSDLLEIVGLCDRVLVMNRGRIAGELQRPDITEANVLRLAFSPTKQANSRSIVDTPTIPSDKGRNPHIGVD